VFLEQLPLSREYNRPAIIHCRKAWERMLEL
jgi:Tat protein secretion system quality control protein TatD with DNase activity